MTTALIIAAICLCFEAFFSGSEIAVVSMDRVKFRHGVGMSQRSRSILESFMAAPQRLLATTLIGTQIAVVVSTANITLALSRHTSLGRAELLTLICLTPVLVIFGEIIPKSIAQQHADRLAPKLAYPLWVASLILRPLVSLSVRFTLRVARRLGVDAPRKLVKREDLALIIKSGGGGDVTDGERRMITRIFAFGERTVGDVMVPLSSVVALDEQMLLADAVREMSDKGYTRYPIYRERIDRMVGMVHGFSILKAGRRDAKVGDLMYAPIYAPENQLAVELLVLLQRQRQGMAIVVDEYGGAVGVVTLEDILEEIVGEIEDEFDIYPSLIRRQGDGVWRVRARAPIDEVNRQLMLGLPTGDDYQTIGGLVLDYLRHIPRVGEKVKLDGLLITVVEGSARAVEEVEIRLTRRRLK